MELPIKPYIKNRLKTSYAVEGPETQYTIDCGDGVNILTASKKAQQAMKDLDFSLAQLYPHTVTMKEAIQRYWAPHAEIPLSRIFLGEGSQSLLYDVCRCFLYLYGPGVCFRREIQRAVKRGSAIISRGQLFYAGAPFFDGLPHF